MSIFMKNTRIYISIIIRETLYETYEFSIQYLKSNRTLYIDYIFSEEVTTSYLDRNSIKDRAEVQNACPGSNVLMEFFGRSFLLRAGAHAMAAASFARG